MHITEKGVLGGGAGLHFSSSCVPLVQNDVLESQTRFSIPESLYFLRIPASFSIHFWAEAGRGKRAEAGEGKAMLVDNSFGCVDYGSRCLRCSYLKEGFSVKVSLTWWGHLWSLG